MMVHSLALEQAKAGHQVYVLNPWSRNKARFKRRTQLPYRMISFPPKYELEVTSRYPLRKAILELWLRYLQRRFCFNAWHLHFAHPAGVALPVLQHMGVEPVLTCHGIDVQILPAIGYGMRLDPNIDRQITDVLRRCRKLVAISSDMRRLFLDAGCAQRFIFDIPTGVAFDHVNSVAREAALARVRREYGLSPTSRIILTVGRNTSVKRFDLIPEMVTSLRRCCTEAFTWIVVGPGCESLCTASQNGCLRHLGPFGIQPGLEAAVPLSPHIRLVELLRAADVFAFPTRTEGLPLVVLEAMAAALPVVSTDVSGVVDLVEHGGTGLLSREGSPEEMVDHIATLLSNPQMRADMGAKGRQKARNYDWRVIAQHYVNLYARPVT